MRFEKMSKLNGPLHNAANNGEADRVHGLLELGADPDSPNKHGDPALVLATLNGHADVVDMLVQRGANPFVHGPGRTSAIDLAISNGNEVIFEALIAVSQQATADQLREALYW